MSKDKKDQTDKTEFNFTEESSVIGRAAYNAKVKEAKAAFHRMSAQSAPEKGATNNLYIYLSPNLKEIPMEIRNQFKDLAVLVRYKFKPVPGSDNDMDKALLVEFDDYALIKPVFRKHKEKEEYKVEVNQIGGIISLADAPRLLISNAQLMWTKRYETIAGALRDSDRVILSRIFKMDADGNGNEIFIPVQFDRLLNKSVTDLLTADNSGAIDKIKAMLEA